MGSVEDMPEHVVHTMEHGFAFFGILFFAFLLPLMALPVTGEYVIEASEHDLNEAYTDENGGGDGHGKHH